MQVNAKIVFEIASVQSPGQKGGTNLPAVEEDKGRQELGMHHQPYLEQGAPEASQNPVSSADAAKFTEKEGSNPVSLAMQS